MMKRLLENGRLIVIAPVLTLFVSAFGFSLYGTFLAAEAVARAVVDPEQRGAAVLVPKFFGVIDVFLLAVVLYVFAVGLYELFIGKLAMPAWLVIESLSDLKSRLASVVILFVAIAFVKYLVVWQDAREAALFAVATALLIGSLLAYYWVKEQK